MTNGCKVFKSEVNGRDILLNLDTERFTWTRVPSDAEAREAIAAWERSRIDLLWEMFEKPFGRGKVYITGFAQTPTGTLRYFRQQVVKEAFGITLTRVQPLAPLVHAHGIVKQVEILRTLKPHSLEELKTLISVHAIKALFPCDLAHILQKSGSITAVVRTLGEQLSSNAVPHRHSESYRELLMLFRARGWLMFPAAYDEYTTGGNVRWTPFYQQEYAGQLYPMFEEINRNLTTAQGHRTNKTGLGLTMIAAVSATCFEDFSRELIDALEELFLSVKSNKQVSSQYAEKRPGSVRSTVEAFRRIWNRNFPSLAYAATRKQLLRKDEDLMRTRGEYKWVAHAKPEMHAWVEPLAKFVEERQGGRIKAGPIADLNWFMDYLLSLDASPARPEDVVRHLHIHDPTLNHSNTFMMRLRTSNLTTKRQYRILRTTKEFFMWYPDWLYRHGKLDAAQDFKSPVTDLEKISQNNTRSGTHRMALPSWVLNELRRTLTDNDFAIPKQFRNDWVPVFDSEQQKTVRVWWPGVAICLGLMLDLPLRSHQGRWLDSGELDEFRYDFAAKKEIRNEHSGSIPGRREQALRLLRDPISGAEWVGLYVNTNKTALFDGKSPAGYEIPWVSQQTADLLHRMEVWNRRYQLPLVKPVTYDNEGIHKATYAKVDRGLLPQIAPLFRDPRHPQSNVPVGRDKLARLWAKILHETEKRVQVERGLPDFELTKLDERGNRTWKYDLHTLRVSGISALIENGVPLEVVSQFVAGHATLVMTLWYTKFAPAKLRREIERASERAQAESDFIGGQSFVDHVEEFSPFLLSKGANQRASGSDPAFAALKEHTGIWSISTDGICPGTSCSTGGEYQPGAAEYGPVPGGRRCGLCRYWITGPAFLLGQMAAVNSLAYEIRKKGLALKAERDRLIDVEDAGQLTRARYIRDRIEAMERELAIDLAEWQARYSYAVASSEHIDDYMKLRSQLDDGCPTPVAMLTANTHDELKITLQEADEFILLEHVTQMSQFLPGFRNRAAMQEKHVLLAQLLGANGIPAKYLVTLDDEQRDAAANLMTATLLQFVEAHDLRLLVDGEIRLNDIAGLEPALRELAAPDTLIRVAREAEKAIPLKEV